MKNRTRLAVALFLSAGLCVAQQPQQQQQPASAPDKNPGAAPAVTGGGTQATQPYGPLFQPPITDSDVQEKSTPDTRPLSGILGLTLGWARAEENRISTSFNVTQSFDSNPVIFGPSSDWTRVTSVGGGLTLHRAAQQHSLDLGYSGGVTIYQNTEDYFAYHGLNLSEAFSVKRWTFTLADNLTYSPQGGLGAGLGVSGFGAGAVDLSGLSSQLTPNQSVSTALSRQLGNTVGGQAQYGLSPLSSITAGVTYGNVFFPDSSFGNTHQFNVRSGYNRNWTAKDTGSILYTYSSIRGSGNSFAQVDAHSIQLAYARRVTGRLSFSVSAGPQIRRDIAGGDWEATWTLSTGLQYKLRDTGINGSYVHGTNGAAGVGGATNDTFQLGVTRVIGRAWSVGASGSISQNEVILGGSRYRTGYGGVQVQRGLGQHASAFFSYGYQRQTANSVCTGVLCQGLTRHVIAVGFSFTPRTWILQ